MGLLEPTGLLAGLLALPILALWILRPRRRQRVIGSTLLWRQALDNVQASQPWQRLRWHILLALQLAAIAALALALARPFQLAASGLAGETFVLLDASASMQATDVSPSRFAVAKQLIGQTIDQLPRDGRLTIVLMADEPRLLIARSGDRRSLHAALDAAQPTIGGASLAAALSLIAPLAAESPRTRVLVYSDGGTDDATRLGQLPFPVDWIRVGGATANVAIAAFATQQTEQGPVALARIANTGSSPVTDRVELWADGRLYDARQITVPAGESISETWATLPKGAQALEARLSGPDALALDNRAFATITPGQPVRLLLITSGNPFLRQALQLTPGVQLGVAEHLVDDATADIVIYDGVAPSTLPASNVLLIHPPVGSLPWPIGSDRSVDLIRVVNTSPINRFIDLGQVHVRSTRAMTVPPDAQVLIADSTGPLLAVREVDRRRVGVLGFDLHQSDLPLDSSFPVLIANLIDWLRPGSSEAGRSIAPGSAVNVVPWPAATKVVLVRPDGSTETLAPPFPARPIADTDELGIYQVVQSAPGQPDRTSWFAVNLFSPRESNLTPPPSLPVEVGKASATVVPTSIPLDLWPWVAVGTLVILVAEWWVYRRAY